MHKIALCIHIYFIARKVMWSWVVHYKPFGNNINSPPSLFSFCVSTIVNNFQIDTTDFEEIWKRLDHKNYKLMINYWRCDCRYYHSTGDCATILHTRNKRLLKRAYRKNVTHCYPYGEG